MKNRLRIFVIVLGVVFAACSSSSDSDDDMVPEEDKEALIAAQNYFNNTLKAVIDSKCVSCHEGQHNKNNAFNYGVFTNARNSATSMFNQVNAGTMPKDADKLPQSEIDMFKEFKDLVDAID